MQLRHKQRRALYITIDKKKLFELTENDIFTSMELFGFKIDKEILLASPQFLNFFLVVSLLAIIKVAFGKEIVAAALFALKKINGRSKNKKEEDWVAECKTRQGWIQKADGYPLGLENRHLKKLSFEVSPVGTPANWRGGVIVGNEKYQPQSIVDTDNSLLFHVGAPPPIDKAQYVWYYNQDHKIGHPASTTITKDDNTRIRFQIEIDKYHWLKVMVNGQQVYNSKIPSLFRNKVYLLAWGDHANCKVQFTNIRYTLL